jgi:micrococcal nuclease
MYSRFFDFLRSPGRRILLFTLLVLPGMCLPGAAETLYGTGVQVVDGDSFVVMVEGREVEVRLYGIDCPEYSQPYSRKAREFTRDRIVQKNISMTTYYKDPYGRIVAEVQSADGILNSDLVEAGLAWVSSRFCRKRQCGGWKLHEEKARAERRGLWRDSHPVPPWIWKRQKKKR